MWEGISGEGGRASGSGLGGGLEEEKELVCGEVVRGRMEGDG